MSQRWWLLSSMVLCAFAGPAFGQTVEFLDAQGFSLQDPYFEGSRAYLRVVDPAASTSVTVTVSAFLSGDAEALSLAETGAGSGVFEGSIELSIAAPAPDGRLQTSRDVTSYPYRFDDLAAAYGAASDFAGTRASTVEIIDASGNPADTFVVGDRIYFRVVDAMANSTSAVDTTVANLSANVGGNWSEIEQPTLTETGADTSIFEGSLPTMADSSPTGMNSIFELEPGDLSEIRHYDANGQTHSFDQARAISSLPVTIEWVDDANQPLTQAYEFSNPRLRVTDGASAGLGALVARVTSDLRGDEEWVNLNEDIYNPGVFLGAIYTPGTLATYPPWSDGLLEVTENAGPPLQRDTIRAFLEGCSAPPCPADAVPTIGSTIRLTDSELFDVDVATPGFPIFIELIDHAVFYDSSATAFVESQAGDSELVSLEPAWNSPYQPRYNAFRTSIAVEVGPTVWGDGVLQVQEPDTITVRHSDPLGLSSSTDSAAVASVQIEFLDRSGNPVDFVLAGGDVRARVLYPAGNANPSAADTLTVVVRSRQATGAVRDTESLQLFETGPNTAVFTGEMPGQAYYYALADGVLQTWSTNGQNDTVEIALESTTAAAVLIPAILRITDVSGADVTNIAADGTLYLRLESDYSNSPMFQDAAQIRAVSLTTGDEEYFNLQETGLDTSLFQGSIPTSSAASPVPGNGVIEARLGETIRASFDNYFFGAAVDLVAVGDGFPTSSPPNAVDDAATTPDDLPVSINVLANDSDPDGHTFQIISFTQGTQGGTVSQTDPGVLTYAPPPYFTGVDTFTYRLRDQVGDEDSATVTVTVELVNDPPSANDDAFATDEEQPAIITPTDNDRDPEGQGVRIIAVTQGSQGAVAIYDAFLGYVSYTPQPNATGSDSFTYTVQDPQGATATATVSVTIRPLQDPPVAVNDTATTTEDTAVLIYVRDNDSDPDGDTVWISNTTQGAHGGVGADAVKINYVPAANYYGTDSFTYTINDGNGNYATATVTVTITPTPDVPVAVTDDVSLNEDTPATIAVLGNDNDPDGDPISLTAVTQGFHGSVTINPNGSVTYTSAANYNGSDWFDYTIQDGTGRSATARVNLTILNVNDPPVAADDSVTTQEDTPTPVYVTTNDSDPDGESLTVSGFTQGAHGTVTLNAGLLQYAPEANYHGSDTFTYTVRDFAGATNTATVTVTITPVWDAPNAVSDAAATAEDSAVNVAVLSNDNDVDGDPLSITAVTQGANGSVTFNASSVTYTPRANFNGADTFTYTVSDGTGTSATASVSVTISAVNDAPNATNDSGTAVEDSAVTVSILTNDSDLDGDTLSVTAVTQGSNGSVIFDAGSVTYTPTANFNGSDAFTYTISDGNGGTATAMVSITINAANDAPDAANDSAAANEDSAVTISVLANDTDVDGEAVILVGVTQGTRGSVVQNANGTVTYTPSPNAFGADTFSYTVRDAAGLTDSAAVTVSVAPVNDPPDAIDDSATTNEGSSPAIPVVANDADIEGDALTVIAVTAPAHGTATINGDGTVTYSPAPTYSGSDSFIYTVSDGSATDNATVTIQVKDIIANVAVLGTHSVWLQSGADVLSGDVIANAAGSAPFLNSTELSIAGGATTAAGWDVQGNRVTIAGGAVVASDVYYNQLANSGTVNGAQYTPLSLPVFAALPAFPAASPGSSDVNVANNGNRTLAAGSYRDLIVGRKATVTFTGGVYHFRSIRVDREARLFFSGGSEIRVQQKMSTNTLTGVGPAAGSSVTAASIVFYVAGINGTGGGLSETPKAVEIGTDNLVSANVYAPNGTLWLKDRVQATGSFLGRDVQIGIDGQVSLRSAW